MSHLTDKDRETQVEALARIIYCSANAKRSGNGLYAVEADHLARAVLASHWLAAFVAAREDAARAEAWDEAAAEMYNQGASPATRGELIRANPYRAALPVREGSEG